MIKLYNTMTGEKEEFKSVRENKVGIYVCGVTVYDLCHIGHARSSVVFDTIRRYFKYKGYDVTFIKNFTDIDDKIIKKSNDNNEEWTNITEKYIKEHDADMDSLYILRPDHTPKATEYIDEMINLCNSLIEKGFAYTSNGDVYFRVRNFKEYGKLSKRNLEDLQSGARVEINESKEDPLDFALWKNSKPGEPYWQSPWGEGRPGWHIECSAMSSKLLGLPFDIHGGGKDLIFPHHENEIAQSEASENKILANYWMHNGFVNIDKEKMSKSLGNFLTIKDILKEFHPETLRFFLLSTQYRNPLDFSLDKLIDTENALDRIYTLIDEISHYKATGKNDSDMSEIASLYQEFKNSFEEAMNDDFNTAAAISVIFETVRRINILLSKKISQNSFSLLKKYFEQITYSISNVLGLLNLTSDEWFKSNLSINYSILIEMIDKRNQARKDKDFATADQIRDELKSKNIELLDTLDGTRFRAKKVREK